MPVARPRIAIVGSGLAGSVLAGLLGPGAAVVVYERGPNWLERPQDFETTNRPLGLDPSFNYGVGGTTHLWHGGMIEMQPGELATAWPETVRDDLAHHYLDVVTALYGEVAAKAWTQRTHIALSDGALLTSIFYPAAPFRAAAGKRFDNCDLRSGEQVLSLEEDDGGVTVASRTAGGPARERFDCVILAAGGINSPLVLRRSGLGGPAAGNNFTDHPMGFVAKLAGRDIRSIYKRLSGGANDFDDSESLIKLQDGETGLWSAFYLRPAAGRSLRSDPYAAAFGFLGATGTLQKYKAALPQMTDPDFLYQAMENRFGVRLPSRHGYVLAVNEQEMAGQGSVSETSAGGIRLDWRVSDEMEGAIRRNLARLAGVLDADLIPRQGALRERLWSAAHHSGTCRISGDPSSGVVDESLRVHGTQRIFVCDGAALPSTGCTNTGLTIGALCHRLARHLRTELDMAPETPKSTARGAAEDAVDVLISGAGGRIGQMVRRPLVASGTPWRALNLRDGGDAPPAARIFLHLANAHDDTDANAELQRRAAAAVETAGVKEVIVTMSFVTISTTGEGAPDGSAFNYGFACTSPNAYPQGKLAAERFWLDWQRAAADRKVLFVYIPTISGPHSEWTQNLARHAPGKTLLVPAIERFFVVTEDDLTALLADALQSGLSAGVERRIALSTSGPLAEAIASDRADPVQARRLPGVVWRICALADRQPLLDKGLSAWRKIKDIAIRRLTGRAIVPIAASYLHLFKAQSDLADRITGKRDRR